MQIMWQQRNTVHLLFECGDYSEPLWAITENVIRETAIREEIGGIFEHRTTCVSDMYNVTMGVPSKHVRIIRILIQEIKKEYM